MSATLASRTRQDSCRRPVKLIVAKQALPDHGFHRRRWRCPILFTTDARISTAIHTPDLSLWPSAHRAQAPRMGEQHVNGQDQADVARRRGPHAGHQHHREVAGADRHPTQVVRLEPAGSSHLIHGIRPAQAQLLESAKRHHAHFRSLRCGDRRCAARTRVMRGPRRDSASWPCSAGYSLACRHPARAPPSGRRSSRPRASRLALSIPGRRRRSLGHGVSRPRSRLRVSVLPPYLAAQ